jgi:hypothetical protein
VSILIIFPLIIPFNISLLEGCNVSHEYKTIKKTPTEAKLEFTNCPYANAFRKVDAPEIGEWFCLVDDPAAKLFNKNIHFEITKRLMDGDSICNHHFMLDENQSSQRKGR